jgi:hypothetical protein
MKSLTLAGAVAVGALCGLSCSVEGQVSSKYSYKGFDTNGTLIVEGTLKLSVNTSNRIQGDWSLHKIKDVPKLGPQTGSGKLEGRIEQGRVTLDFNPGWADNNVMLNGQISRTNITGTWGYYGFGGQLNGRRFEAVKQ